MEKKIEKKRKFHKKEKHYKENKALPAGGTDKERYSLNHRSNLNGKEEEKHSLKKKDSRCPYSNRCGGCQLIDVAYQKQLKNKQEQLKALLGGFGRLEPIIGMENPEHYRNKVHAVFGINHKKQIVAGVYEAKTHRIVDVESCFLENEKATRIIRTIKDLLRSFKIKAYDEDSGYGLLRHVLVRTARETGQIMVVLVLASPILPSKNNFVKALRKEHPEISTVIINVNDRSTSMVLGEKETVIYGKGYIEDVLCGKSFRISSKSFYQVNSVQTEKLYSTALEFAALTGKEIILDAYCGIGTIGIIAADSAKRVIGVELNKDAVKDAVNNAKLNGIKNIDIYNNDAGQFMLRLAGQKERIDVVFMDPPRSGSDEAFLKSVVACGPLKIVYVSCNPLTLARDLKYLTANGYKVERMRGCDMFCHTEHVETVVLLSLKTGQPKLEVTMEVDSDSNYTPEERATYQKIKAYVKEKYGVNVHTSYIAQVKRMCGLDMGENYNKSKKENPEVKQCPQEKVEYIKDALKFFRLM